MSEVRSDFNTNDPWGEFAENAAFAGDHIYGGDHERIENLVLLTDVVVRFEFLADDFRYWDERSSPLADWEKHSCFSETHSIRVANGEVEL